MRICALVLNWKRPEETLRCLASLRQHAPGMDVLVVDNASGDGSIERIRTVHPDVPVLENLSNAGYAGGNNAGFRLLQGADVPGTLHGNAPQMPDAILVLNNDVQILDNTIPALIRAFENDPARGLIAPVSLSAEDPEVLDFHRAHVDLRNVAVNAQGRGERRTPAGDVESDYAPGSAFLITMAALNALGGFDERFFLVWEDVDLSLRCVDRGFGKPLIVADSQVLHEGSVSFGGAATPLYQYFFTRNSFLIVDKHLRGLRKLRATWLLRRRYSGWVSASPDELLAAAIDRGARDGYQGLFGPPPPDLDKRD